MESNQWPTPQQMLTELQTSGVLNPSAQPAAQVQPLPQPPATTEVATQTQPQLLTLTDVADPTAATDIEAEVSSLIPQIGKVVGFFLTLQSLFGIYKSLSFIFVDYQELEQHLLTHTVTQGEVNAIASKAVLTMISTVISIFFALKLTILKNKTAKSLSIGIGIVMFIANSYILGFFNQLGLGQSIGQSITNLLEFLTGLL